MRLKQSLLKFFFTKRINNSYFAIRNYKKSVSLQIHTKTD